MLKAYMVHDGDPGQHAIIVFAERGQEARVKGHGVEDLGCEGFLEMRAERRKDLDHYLDQSKTAAYVAPLAVMRDAGWTCEDGTECPCCGRNDFDRDEWKGCSECDYCPDCGHDDDCAEAEAVRP